MNIIMNIMYYTKQLMKKQKIFNEPSELNELSKLNKAIEITKTTYKEDKTKSFPLKIYNNIEFPTLLFISNNSYVYTDIDDKYILKEYIPNRIKDEYVLDEIKILKDLSKYNNTNIANIITSSQIYNTYSFLFESFGIDLFEYMTNNILNIKLLDTIICDLMKTTAFLHSHMISHGDIKLENILIKDGHIKLCDFGYASYMTDDYKIYNKRGTLDYISPSLYKNRIADGRLNDLWAIGIVICVLIYKHPLDNKKSNNNQNSNKMNLTYKEDPTFWVNLNYEFSKYTFTKNSDKFLYRFRLQNLLKMLLISDEKIKYTKIKSYQPILTESVDIEINNISKQNISDSNNLCEILVNHHELFDLNIDFDSS